MGDGLAGQRILQLEGSERQPVDEQGKVERAARGVQRIAKLASDRKAVLREASGGLRIAGRGQREIERHRVRAVAHARSQHVDDAAIGDLVSDAGEEGAALRAVSI
ncbi:hypothetical protein [Mesorhizobium sp. M0185]|uniref:hypothetical protein n=1 Tax=Mesorhizobium sp. M0185 TaxID=2956907 RepID=UPI003335B943